MPGTCLCRLLLLCAAVFSAVPSAYASGRSHEIQFRRNDYVVVPPPTRLQAAGLSKALLRVFSDDEKNGGLYFSTGLFPVVRDTLGPWAAAYANAGVSLWAWMGARKFAWLAGRRELLDREWSGGEARSIPKLDLFNPQAQELVVSLFARLAGQPVQGILIQDDLIIQRGEGFSSWGRGHFNRASGMEADPSLMLAAGTPHHRAWQELKAARVGETLKKIVAACKAANPAIQVGLNVHYEAPLTPERARSWYAFDAAAAGASGIDLFYLMAYHRQMKAEMKLAEGENRLYFRRMLDAALKQWGAKLAVKLQVRDWRSGRTLPLDELQAYYDLIPAGVERVCFAAADPDDIDLISQVIEKSDE